MMRFGLIMLAAAALSLAGGCGGGDDNDSNGDGASPTAETSAAATQTPGSGGEAPSVIQRVIDAASSGDPAEIEAIIDFQTEACITTPPTGQTRPPVCRTAEVEGTEVEGILISVCEGTFIPRDEVVLDDASSDAYEFFGAYEFKSFPAGAEYVVVFERPRSANGSSNIAYVTNDEGVISILYGCATTPQQFVEFAQLGAPIVTPD